MSGLRYEHVLSYVSGRPWALMPGKLMELLSVLAFRANGGEFTEAEIQARIGNGQDKARVTAGGSVAVVPIRGVIAHRMSMMEQSSGGTSTEAISAMLRQAMADHSVGIIVLDVESPGGTVTGMMELAAEVFALREQGEKRIVAVSNGTMGSGAYWIASQAHEIVGIPSSVTGSLGVFTVHDDLSAALEKEGVTVTVLSAGRYKVEQLPFAPLSEEAKAFLQSRVDESYVQFVKDVARGRGVTPAAVRSGYGEGRALGAKDAKAVGLIDRIATMDETLARVMGTKPKMSLRASATEPAPVAAATEPAEDLAALAASVPQTSDDDYRRHLLL